MEATSGIDNGKTEKRGKRFDLFKPVSVRPDGTRIESSNYAVRFQFQGKRTCRSLGTPDYRLAQQRASELIKQIRGGGWRAATGVRGDPTSMSIEDFMAKFRESAEARKLRPRSISEIIKTFARLGRNLGAIRINQITPAKIQTWIEGAVRGGMKPVSVRTMIKTSACPFSKASLQAMGMPDLINPFKQAVWPKVENEPFRAPPRPWIMDLMATGLAELQGADRIAFALCLGAGLRWNEAVTLTWANVTPNGIRVLAALAKGRQERTVPVGAKLAGVLNTAANTSGPVIETADASALSRRLCTWLRRHGIEDAKPVHFLRKCYGSLAVADAGIFVASKLLGHASIEQTASVYAGIVDALPAVNF